ncbi:MAG: class I SAM-dependent methyltransferase, partial [Streptosporangiaceae bacterium]
MTADGARERGAVSAPPAAVRPEEAVADLAADQAAVFVLENSSLRPVPLVPEISLHLADDAFMVWEETERTADGTGLPPPFWAFAWPGGQAIARYVLDHPEIVAGRAVLDLGS